MKSLLLQTHRLCRKKDIKQAKNHGLHIVKRARRKCTRWRETDLLRKAFGKRGDKEILRPGSSAIQGSCLSVRPLPPSDLVNTAALPLSTSLPWRKCCHLWFLTSMNRRAETGDQTSASSCSLKELSYLALEMFPFVCWFVCLFFRKFQEEKKFQFLISYTFLFE